MPHVILISKRARDTKLLKNKIQNKKESDTMKKDYIINHGEQTITITKSLFKIF